MSTICKIFDKTRQAYYKWIPHDFYKEEMEEIIIKEVKKIRETAPGIGCSTLFKYLSNVFGENMIGRDRFYELMREEKLMVKRQRSISTTNSRHRYNKYPNRSKHIQLTRANQLWVSDITYIKLFTGRPLFLHLTTDAYSRKIVGWKLATSLEAKHTKDALQMAIHEATANGVNLKNLMHHSDRGTQYCCDMYVGILESYGITISMTEGYKPTDNAKAERVNGIIKQLFFYKRTLHSLEQVQEILEKGIAFYNNERPHSSLGYLAPALVHSGVNPTMNREKAHRRNSAIEPNLEFDTIK